MAFQSLYRRFRPQRFDEVVGQPHLVDALRNAELEKALSRMDLDDGQRAAVEAFSKALVNKILHEPTARLRREAEREEGMAYLEVARMLFGLDDEDGDAS